MTPSRKGWATEFDPPHRTKQVLSPREGDHVRRKRISLDTFRWWPVSGKHRASDAPKPLPTEPQIKPDARDPKYDHPSTFGKGWIR